MLSISTRNFIWIGLVLATGTLACGLSAQTKKPGTGSGYNQFTVGTDAHHDVSRPLRDQEPLPPPRHRAPIPHGELPASHRQADALSSNTLPAPEVVNGGTGAATSLTIFNIAGVGNFFSGPKGSFTPATTPSDATGAVGTTQYLQWVDDSFAVFSKSTGNTLYGPAAGNSIWTGFGGPCEANNDGQPTVNFDKMASRWVVSQHALPSGGPYYQCLAVSTTADATGTWNRYSFQISDVNAGWMNLNPKLGVWSDGYYMGFDMYAGTTFEGPKFCSLNRAKMLLGQGAGIQCIQLGNEYYSPVISDVDGSTPPPTGAPAYFAADDLGFYALDFWKFHVDWNDSQNTSLSFAILLPQPTYGLSCGSPCILQPNQMSLNPHGSHVLGRMPYRNYGSYQSLVSVENAETVTTPVFYEARVNSNGDLYMYQEGELHAPMPAYRFNPSIAEDRAGNIAVAYNLSNLETFPGQYVSSRAPGDTPGTLGNETLLNPGNGSQTSPEWDSRSALTVDPNDDCTFYYTEQYQPMDGTNNWSTQIESFTLAGCIAPVTLQTVPSGLKVSVKEIGGAGITNSAATPFTEDLPEGTQLVIEALSPQSGPAGTQYVFSSWSDNGTQGHTITVPSAGATYTANFNTQYALVTGVNPVGTGTVAPATSWALAGSTVNITVIPATGYTFSSWTGNVANPANSTTSVTMSGPETVVANLVPLPTTVNTALTSQSGPTSARVWTFSLTNAGPGVANGIAINSFSLTQTAGTACKPAVVSKLPIAVGNEAVGAALSASVTINFTGCDATGRFSLAIANTENNGASHSTKTLTNLSQ